mmetsp:Transcript_100657/g.290804  ORF Transcript_100657/g.290804 Transcript_100657/m.290804 type:complete len:282 (+) Transcript_100657:622-1467(+)
MAVEIMSPWRSKVPRHSPDSKSHVRKRPSWAPETPRPWSKSARATQRRAPSWAAISRMRKSRSAFQMQKEPSAVPVTMRERAKSQSMQRIAPYFPVRKAVFISMASMSHNASVPSMAPVTAQRRSKSIAATRIGASWTQCSPSRGPFSVARHLFFLSSKSHNLRVMSSEVLMPSHRFFLTRFSIESHEIHHFVSFASSSFRFSIPDFRRALPSKNSSKSMTPSLFTSMSSNSSSKAASSSGSNSGVCGMSWSSWASSSCLSLPIVPTCPPRRGRRLRPRLS